MKLKCFPPGGGGTYSIGMCTIEVSLLKFVGSPTTGNLLSVKRIFEYVKDLFLGSTLQKCLAPAVTFVILMAQRPSANIVWLRVRENFIRSS